MKSGSLKTVMKWTPLSVENNAAVETEQASPDLQALVAAHGGYDRVTPEAWAEFRQRMADWERSVWCGEFLVSGRAARVLLKEETEMTPEGTMEKGELLAILKAAGIEKPSKAAVRGNPVCSLIRERRVAVVASRE